MPYTKDELIQELRRCYEENGHTRTTLLNDQSNDYPSQVTYNNHFGTMKDARDAANLYGGHTREAVINSIERCFEKYDTVKISLLNEDDELLNASSMYAHFDALSDALSHSNVNKAKVEEKRGRRKRYTDEELIQMLVECKKEMGDTKTTTVNEYNGCPSSQTYRYQFDSLQEAREIADINVEFKKSKFDKAEDLLDDTNYEQNADAHIYILKIKIDGEDSYYVGESRSIVDRIASHMADSEFRTKTMGQYGEKVVPSEETNRMNSVQIESVEYTIPLYREKGESDIEFRRRRKLKEHHEYLSVAIDKDTLDVYGGR